MESAAQQHYDSINDPARNTLGKTYREVIQEAVDATLQIAEEREQFMDFVSAFPTKDLSQYDRGKPKGYDHPEYRNRTFFRRTLSQVMGYSPIPAVNFDLRYALCGIVDQASYDIVGSTF